MKRRRRKVKKTTTPYAWGPRVRNIAFRIFLSLSLSLRDFINVTA
jgi:hypothetical protein